MRYAGEVRASRCLTPIALSLLLLASAAACSGGGDRARGGGAAGPGDPQPVAGAGGGEPAEAAVLSREDCLRYIDRMIEIGLAETRASSPADHVPTDEQVEEIRTAMRSEIDQHCVGQARGPFDCAMKATTSTEVRACFPPETPPGAAPAEAEPPAAAGGEGT